MLMTLKSLFNLSFYFPLVANKKHTQPGITCAYSLIQEQFSLTSHNNRSKIKTNKSTQRIYNTFEKGQTPPPLLLFFLHNFLSFFIRKKERILPCLVALESTPFQFTLSSLPSHFSPPFSFPSVSYVLSEFGRKFWQRAYVPSKCLHKRKEASHVTPCD